MINRINDWLLSETWGSLMDLKKLRDQLIKHEGVVLHAYEDHLGYLTIGVGRLIDKRRGGGISKSEAMYLLDQDIYRVVTNLNEEHGFHDFPAPVKEALANMAFQLGHRGVMNFKKMWQALRERDWGRAADEALDSRWAEQTPRRAQEVAQMIREAE
jgi:lysozyme